MDMSKSVIETFVVIVLLHAVCKLLFHLLLQGNNTIGRVDTQTDGNGGYAFISSSDSVRLCFDLPSNLIEVYKLLSFTVQELCILCERGWKDIR